MFSEIRRAEKTYKDDPDWRYWFNVLIDSRMGSERSIEAEKRMDEIQAKYESAKNYN